MKLLTLAVLASALGAQDRLTLTPQEQEQRAVLELKAQTLNEQFERLRWQVCWDRGVPRVQCGDWLSSTVIQLKAVPVDPPNTNGRR